MSNQNNITCINCGQYKPRDASKAINSLNCSNGLNCQVWPSPEKEEEWTYEIEERDIWRNELMRPREAIDRGLREAIKERKDEYYIGVASRDSLPNLDAETVSFYISEQFAGLLDRDRKEITIDWAEPYTIIKVTKIDVAEMLRAKVIDRVDSYLRGRKIRGELYKQVMDAVAEEIIDQLTEPHLEQIFLDGCLDSEVKEWIDEIIARG